MKKILIGILILMPLAIFCQKTPKKQGATGIGVMAGLNFSNVTNASAIGASSQTGWHAGAFLNIGAKIIGSRTELLYSRQGYDYSSGSKTGSVTHDYIILAQLMAVNITRYVQLQIGMQTGYLINAKVDSSQTTGNASADKLLSYYNRFDYGVAGGLELHPVAGLLIGARYSASLANLYKDYFSAGTNGSPSGSGEINFKNNVVMVFVGYRF